MTLKRNKTATKITLYLTAQQYEMLNRLSATSLKPKTVLVREAIDILFKTPGG